MIEESRKSPTIGVAVWGIGAHAVKSVLPALTASPDVHLIGLLGRDQSKLAKQSELYGCISWQHPEDMLACDAVDVVYIATPTALHAKHGHQVVRNGKHLWCEKPLATNLKDAKRLSKMATEMDVSLCVVCGPRYHPHFFAIRDQIEGGEMGNPLSISANFKFPHMDQSNFRYIADMGGGALLDQGFYLLTVIDDLIPGKLMAISCRLEVEDGYQVDTSGKAQLEFDDGSKADLAWGYGFEYQNALTISGNSGELIASPFFSKPDNHTPFVKIMVQGKKPTIMEIERKNQFVEMISEFKTALNFPDKRQRLIKAAERSQTLIEIATKSSQNNGKFLTVP